MSGDSCQNNTNLQCQLNKLIINIVYQKIMQKIQRTIYHLFSSYKNVTSQSMSLKKLQKSVKQNSNYIKQNGSQVMSLLSTMVQKRQWNSMLQISKKYDLDVIDDGNLWAGLGNKIREVSENVKELKFDELENMLALMWKLRYETYRRINPNLYGQMQKIIQNASGQQVCRLACNTLSTCSQLFVNFTPHFQKSILNEVRKSGTLNETNMYIFTHGIISNFWTPDFINEVKTLTNPQVHKFWKFFNLPSSNLIMKPVKHKDSNPSITQQRIGQMMADLGYVFDTGMQIQGTEVDFYFQPCKLILQFNGLSHYRINELEGRKKFLFYVKWRKSCLINKGFIVTDIHFYEWNKLHGQKAQKLYLMNKIQKFLLKNWVYNPQFNKTNLFDPKE